MRTSSWASGRSRTQSRSPKRPDGAAMAKFAVDYLASPASTAELREMAGMESGSSDTPEDDGSSEEADTSGS